MSDFSSDGLRLIQLIENVFVRYGIAVVTPVFGLQLRLWIEGHYDVPGPFVAPFLTPVLIAAAVGGLMPGLIATVIGVYLCAHYAMPGYGFFGQSAADQAALVTTALLGLGISVAMELMHRMRRRAEATAQALHHSNEQLRMSELRLQQAQLAASCGTWEADLVAGRRYFSPEFSDLMGVPQRHYKSDESILMVHPDDRERVTTALREVRDGLRPTFKIEHRIQHPKRGERWIEARAEVILDATGQPVRLIGASIDITERKQREAALQEAARQKDEFLATLSHELRNPLAPIRNALSILGRREGLDAEVQRLHQMIDRQVSFLVRLVDDLFEVSRISRNKLDLHLERIELAEVLRAAVETSQPVIDSARHELIIETPAQPLYVQGDAVRLVQVLANLLNNAARYTPSGGRIRVSLRRDGAHAELRVVDNGCGIEPASLQRVFETYAQAARSVDQPRGGLGLGLSIVRGLVQLHGGTVRAHSEGRDRGSEFTVRLPLDAVSAQALESGHAPQVRTLPVKALRILIVDDNHDAANSLGELLTLTGNEAHMEYSGMGALSALPEFRPHVLLLDIGMPIMDGFEVARRVRQHPEFSQIKIIALSGWAQLADRARMDSAGFDHYLSKPLEFEQLQKILVGVQALR